MCLCVYMFMYTLTMNPKTGRIVDINSNGIIVLQ